MAPTPRKPGRRTKADELTEFAQTAGVDMQKVADFLGGALDPEKQPETLAEMRDAFMLRLWEERRTLKGIALVQGLKALAQLAAAEKTEDAGKDEEQTPPLLDRLDALPPEHLRVLLTGEIERLRGELAAHEKALEEL